VNAQPAAKQSAKVVDFSAFNETQADSLLDDYVSRINQLRRTDIEAALTELETAFQLLDYHPSIGHQIKLLNLRGFCFGTSGRFDAAFSDFKQALELARENPAGQRIGEIYGFRGVTHYYKGDMPNALNDYTRAIDEFTAANDNEGLSLYLNNLAIIQKFYGQYELALSQYVRSAKLNQASGRDDRLTYNYNNIGILYYELERYSEAESYVLKAYHLYQKVDDELGGANALNNLAYINLYLGKTTQAREYAKRAMEIYQNRDSELGRSSVLSVYAEINIETETGDDTYELIEEAIRIRKKYQSNQTLAENYVQLGRWALFNKDFSRSERNFKLAWVLAEKNVYISEKKAVKKYLAELYQAQGRFEEALAQVIELNQLEAEISKNTNENNMQFLQSKFDLEQSQRNYQLLVEQTKVNELLEKQQRFTLILIIALIIFVLCVFAYYWRRSVVARLNAIQSAEEKSDFLALMSHELRTPMNGVIGAATALENSDSEWEKQQTVSIIKSSGQRLLSLVNDILDLSKIEAGKMQLDCAVFSLRECIEETMELFMFQMGTKQVELVYFINNPYDDVMHGDSNKIKQILINLIGNSIKFTEAGEVLLRVDVELDRETSRTSHSNFYIKCQVKDTGVGISEEQCKKLFNAYT
jgi:signal transduction histidine kinase/Tfp pilus assembly protein PilF